MANGTKLVRLSEGLIKKLEKIREQEKAKGNDSCSYTTAGEILSKRIDAAGGLRENPTLSFNINKN